MTWKWLSHAFAVEPPGPAIPSEAQRAAVDSFCREVARRGLATPALFLMELSRPLNFMGSQALYLVMPLVSLVADANELREFAAFLEQRGSIDYICGRIEACARPGGEHTQESANEIEDATARGRSPRGS